MKLYLQVCGAVMIALVSILTLGSRGKDFGVLLTLCLCVMGAAVMFRYLEPVFEFIHQLEATGALDNSIVTLLLKSVGIGLISEISTMICADAGCGSLGKLLQMLGTALVLWLCLPLFTMLLELIQSILGGL